MGGVTARFRVQRLTPQGDYATEVEMVPDYAQGKNAEWAAATPSGVVRMMISNKAALERFVLNKPVNILFEFPEG